MWLNTYILNLWNSIHSVYAERSKFNLDPHWKRCIRELNKDLLKYAQFLVSSLFRNLFHKLIHCEFLIKINRGNSHVSTEGNISYCSIIRNRLISYNLSRIKLKGNIANDCKRVTKKKKKKNNIRCDLSKLN